MTRRNVQLLAFGFIIGVVVGASGSALITAGDTRNDPLSYRISRSLANSANDATSIDTAVQDRLLRQITEVVQITVARELQRGASVVPGNTSAPRNQTAATSPLDEHREYERLKDQLHDPSFNRGMTWTQVVSLPELQALPKDLRDQLLSEAAEMLTRGELNR